jgi:hypothetical protein
MQKKQAFFVCATMALMWLNQALAQSSYDKMAGSSENSVGASSSKFEIYSSDEKYKLGFKGYLQQNTNYQYRPEGINKHDFNININRARFSIYGSLFDPKLTFLFQTGFERDELISVIPLKYTSSGSSYLRDYYLNVAYNRYSNFRIGKFSAPFSRQFIVPATQMQFYERSLAGRHFQLTQGNRDVGLMIYNGIWNYPYEYALAVVSNGIVARVGYNYNKIDGYDMVDWSGGGLRFGVAANGFLHSDYKSAMLDDIRVGADFILKFASFSANGAFYYQRHKPDASDAAHNLGGGMDAGYLISKKYEPVIRYSWIKFADPNTHRHEIFGGVNYYFYGHNLKLQAYAGANLVGTKLDKTLAGLQFQFAI